MGKQVSLIFLHMMIAIRVHRDSPLREGGPTVLHKLIHVFCIAV